MASLVEDIRQQVAKWQRRQKVNEKLRDLKEHDQYEALVKKDGRGYTASIQCKLCGKNIALGLKGKKPLISNWTRHVGTCIESKRRRPTSMGKLETFFLSPSPTSSSEPEAMSSPSVTYTSPMDTRTELSAFQLASHLGQTGEDEPINQNNQFFRLTPPQEGGGDFLPL